MKSNQKKSNEEMLFLKLMAASIHDVSFDVQLEIANWEEIFNIARSQNILPLIFEKASENKSFLSIPQYQQLAFETITIVAGQARRTEAFLSLYQKFIKANMHPLVMKGIICRQPYGDFCDHRPSGDEDILIPKSEYEQVKRILIENGYEPEDENIKEIQLNQIHEISFTNVNTGLHLEVHINPMGNGNDLRIKNE